MELILFLQWWNLVFELPFLAALMYTTLMGMGIAPSGEDYDVEVEHDLEIDHDVGDVGIEHDVEADHDFEHGIEHVTQDHEIVPYHQGGELVRVLSFFGVGRIPLSLLGTTFFYIFGFVGFAGNQVMAGWGLFPLIYFWFSFGMATFAAVFLTRGFAIQLGRLFPKYQSFGISGVEDLVGSVGEVTNRITETFGTVHVRDRVGNLHEAYCRVRPGEEPIPFGTRVMLADYDREKEVFSVVKFEDPFA